MYSVVCNMVVLSKSCVVQVLHCTVKRGAQISVL